MKINQLLLASLLILAFSFQSCVKDNCERTVTYTKAIPVIIEPSEYRVTIQSESPRALKKPGKIFLKGQYLFINELKEGVHVIDNSIPESPQNIAFIPIIGNVDITIKDNMMYADNYTDLVTIDITDPMSVQQTDRKEDVFRLYISDDGQTVVDYEYEEVTETFNCDDDHSDLSPGDIFFETTAFRNDEVLQVSSGASSEGNQIVNGIGGSLNRFTMVNEYLYLLDQTEMYLYDVSDCAHPTFEQQIDISWEGNQVETIFPYGDNLFIGSNSGMFIYNNTNPANPQFVSVFQHFTACDPVYVKDNYAYVTLRTGNFCEGAINLLEVVDITDLENPILETSFDMENPHGLSIKDDELYLCEGESGLKVFDVTDPLKVGDNKLSQVTSINAYDVIALPGEEDRLLVIGEGGFFQYDASNPNQLVEISSILVE